MIQKLSTPFLRRRGRKSVKTLAGVRESQGTDALFDVARDALAPDSGLESALVHDVVDAPPKNRQSGRWLPIVRQPIAADRLLEAYDLVAEDWPPAATEWIARRLRMSDVELTRTHAVVLGVFGKMKLMPLQLCRREKSTF